MNVTQEDIFSIIENVGVSADISNLAADASLTDSGIDSLEMMNIFLGIEEKFGIHIPDEDIDALDSVNNIINYLSQR